MSYEAKVFRVLIASPSDVIDEREIAVKTIQEWNDLNSPERRIVILPLRWETHTAPEYGNRPQEVINRQIVDHCDLVIGIFWTRIGSPTGAADSGTLEEIERVASQGRTVMLYFSQVKKDPNQIEIDQLQRLREFKEKTFPKALIESFSSQIEFRDKLAKQLEIQLRTLIAAEKQTTDSVAGSAASEISLEFCDSETGSPLGAMVTLEATNLSVTGIEEVPNYGRPENALLQSSVSDYSKWLTDRDNRSYYREYVEYFVKSALLRPVAFVLRNNGVIGARDIFIDMRITSNIPNITLGTNVKLNLKKPAPQKDSSYSISFEDAFSGVGGESLNVEATKDAWLATFETRALQPKRTVKSKYKIVVGANTSGTVDVEAKIYADILPEPVVQRLHIDMKIEQVAVSALELLEKNGILPIARESKPVRRRRTLPQSPKNS